MQIGRRIYYDKATGNLILDTGERSGGVVETTVAQDFATYAALQDRVPATVGIMELAYGDHAQDFKTCNGYRIDVSNGTPSLLFSYPDPSDPEAPPVYRQSLSAEVEAQKQRLSDIELALAELFTGGV
ncbi:hypothetical protein SAMN05216312_101762 [Cohnella sp. OV330]|uniref:hypothetical protein n=1 Tax=Cohnella sp. OV330 TaxID=1855288 RepID=UPI0008EC4226|nr:hypothetical protein [Cohnella sp. OV330]SFA83194.1 hypothetical protein SAMN05216312_101762 [Cohnella sp. OV330]